MPETLFARLGGAEGIRRIASDLVDRHLENPRISRRFAQSDPAKLKTAATEFFITGSGGPDVYKGKDMISVHKAMNIGDDEFMAVLREHGDYSVTIVEHRDLGAALRRADRFPFYGIVPATVADEPTP